MSNKEETINKLFYLGKKDEVERLAKDPAAHKAEFLQIAQSIKVVSDRLLLTFETVEEANLYNDLVRLAAKCRRYATVSNL